MVQNKDRVSDELKTMVYIQSTDLTSMRMLNYI